MTTIVAPAPTKPPPNAPPVVVMVFLEFANSPTLPWALIVVMPRLAVTEFAIWLTATEPAMPTNSPAEPPAAIVLMVWLLLALIRTLPLASMVLGVEGSEII